MKLSIPFKENHHAMWKWLEENPWNEQGERFNTKRDWPGIKTIYEYELIYAFQNPAHFKSFQCFACQEAICRSNKKEGKPSDSDLIYNISCSEYCPCKKFRATICSALGSLFIKWIDAETRKERSHYAGLIKNAWR